VVSCTSAAGPDGTIAGTCRALRAGTAEVSTMTAPFAGDPHGPPQYLWRLTVEVVP
jgi:polyphosphate kinase 2 (PPK2 family)